jgi:hypothetical protein
MINVDPLSTSSLRVTPKFNDLNLASATGFTTSWLGIPYLVTNWHVLSGRDADTNECLDKRNAAIPNRLEVRFHVRNMLGTWKSATLDLIDRDGKPVWYEHPLGSQVDVAALPIPFSLLSSIQLYPLLISKKPQPTEEQAHVVSHPTASM